MYKLVAPWEGEVIKITNSHMKYKDEEKKEKKRKKKKKNKRRKSKKKKEETREKKEENDEKKKKRKKKTKKKTKRRIERMKGGWSDGVTMEVGRVQRSIVVSH